MDFGQCVAEQIARHPSMTPQDLIKLCYQAAFGAEHLLSDPARAARMLDAEFDQTPALPQARLCEMISPDVYRVNLAAWKARKLPLNWLSRMFTHPSNAPRGGEALLLRYLEAAGQVVDAGGAPFDGVQWRRCLAQYGAGGMGPVHHTQAYREAERPAYRVVSGAMARLLPILKRAARLPQTGAARVIAIDGRAAAGKTTLAQHLSGVLEADVIHMDDFFLPPALRTQSRLSQPGGNVHYERFAQEVLPYLSNCAAFSYRVFDCSKMDYNGVRQIGALPWRIVEGSYSAHPFFGTYAGVLAFLDIEPDQQLSRITARNGEQMARVFSQRWIPLEEAYFQACSVRERADVVLRAQSGPPSL